MVIFEVFVLITFTIWAKAVFVLKKILKNKINTISNLSNLGNGPSGGMPLNGFSKLCYLTISNKTLAYNKEFYFHIIFYVGVLILSNH